MKLLRDPVPVCHAVIQTIDYGVNKKHAVERHRLYHKQKQRDIPVVYLFLTLHKNPLFFERRCCACFFKREHNTFCFRAYSKSALGFFVVLFDNPVGLFQEMVDILVDQKLLHRNLSLIHI